MQASSAARRPPACVPGHWQDVAAAAGLLGADGRPTDTIFAEMSALAARTGAINLGQGVPELDPPASLLADATAAILAGKNQYPPGRGVPELRLAIAEHQRRWYGLDPDPQTEVLVTAGATEAITATVLALCGPGDEVVTLEPGYDSYPAAIALAGARRRVVRLSWPEFRLDADVLATACGPDTRMILLNSPHNPTGRVFDASELASVADIARSRDLLVLTDEVYEHLTFDGRLHVPLATLPGMAERTITVSSAGKTFSVTGWKIGWLHARADLVDQITAVKQFLTYVNGAPFQPAVAAALALPDDVFAETAARLQAGRERLLDGLIAAGFEVRAPDGGYFVVADAAGLGYPDGAALCRALPDLAGVVAVPLSAFYASPESGGSLIRFNCAKRPEAIDEAVTRLRRLRPA